LCQRPRTVTPAGGAALPVTKRRAASGMVPGRTAHVLMNFIVLLLLAD
jgi:hypothetical protein